MGEGDKVPSGGESPENPYANTELPDTPVSRAGIQTYKGPWGKVQAAHLLRRTLFGPKPEEIELAVHAGSLGTLEQLFTTPAAPQPPVNYIDNDDPDVPLGESWPYAPMNPGVTAPRRNSLIAWMINRMIYQQVSIQEKMELFWHNHFVVELGTVGNPNFLYQYVELLRTHALGNFKTLTEEITINPAMLLYLNGNQNTEVQPNENYARELFELFTVGKGPLIGPGNYTHFTEDDVLAAARVLTGWRLRYNNNNFNPPEGVFDSDKHDGGTKTFSSAFDHHAISNNGGEEYKDLIDMIFNQRETARHICRKLYRWFVYYVITEGVEENIIEPMAQLLIDNQFEIAVPLKALLGSEHFFDPVNMGCMIKNPMDYTLSAIRQFEVPLPDESDYVNAYQTSLGIYGETEKQQMAYLSPPSVAGWSAYYQKPQYYQIWINSATLPIRSTMADSLIAEGLPTRGAIIQIDPLAFIGYVSDPLNPNTLIQEWTQILLPMPLTQDQYDFLKESLIPGLPDYEWTLEYSVYLSDPSNQDQKRAAVAKLKALLKNIMNLAEYHLT